LITVRKEKPLQLYATNISSYVLGKLKQQLEDYFFWRQLMGWKIRAATISVPANFDVSQQLATLEAARQAGFNNVQLISEPAAAALAFRLHQRPGVRHVLVFDFGGGTLDVALLVLDQKTFSVMTSSGDPHLGGEDIDRCILKHFETEFQSQNGLALPPQSVEVQGSLRRHAESIKIELSNVTRVQRVLTSVYQGKSLKVDISRTQFEKFCGDLFDRAIAPVKEVLQVAGMSKEDIGDVVLVGGSSRIPRVRELLTDIFDGATLNTDINPDEAVARGATLTRTCK
jgi:molecular chaperone DnaK (HSP70)